MSVRLCALLLLFCARGRYLSNEVMLDITVWIDIASSTYEKIHGVLEKSQLSSLGSVHRHLLIKIENLQNNTIRKGAGFKIFNATSRDRTNSVAPLILVLYNFFPPSPLNSPPHLFVRGLIISLVRKHWSPARFGHHGDPKVSAPSSVSRSPSDIYSSTAFN